jgi:hypothetical protein
VSRPGNPRFYPPTRDGAAANTCSVEWTRRRGRTGAERQRTRTRAEAADSAAERHPALSVASAQTAARREVQATALSISISISVAAGVPVEPEVSREGAVYFGITPAVSLVLGISFGCIGARLIQVYALLGWVV